MPRYRTSIPFSRGMKLRPLQAAIVLLVFLAVVGWKWMHGEPLSSLWNGTEDSAQQETVQKSGKKLKPGETLKPGVYQVRRAIDGDTLELENEARIRLIGVNTPETVKKNWPVEPWGPEASAFTKEFLRGGVVRLEFDVEPTDRYGRYLAYVYVGNRFLNEELLREGLAQWEPQYRYAKAMKKRFEAAQNEAQKAQRGIWSEKK